SREWRSRYMKFEELLTKAERQGREKGLAEGREQEQSRFHTLISRMTAGGDGDRLAELANAAFLNEMYRKYSV
ncbi:MAG: hypothetical protein NC398_04280, partial [Acetatifactor muris]|nr:hypothetical protein [Acetatifactor muris]MCM1526098.1 hypothetical protein [Bacteroides sp.]